MGFFWVEYQNVPGQCVYAKGGLKFRADEDALLRYFAPILPYVSLNDLIGEAVFWILLPSILAIWTFPIFLYSQGILFAIIATAVLYLIAEILTLIFYIKPLNYLVFIFANPLLKVAAYIVWAIILILSGSILEAIILGIYFLFFAFGLDVLMFGFLLIPLFVKLFSLAPSDQVLRNINWYYGRKFGLDPTEWKMYN